MWSSTKALFPSGAALHYVTCQLKQAWKSPKKKYYAKPFRFDAPEGWRMLAKAFQPLRSA
jgi:hypothetical protein